MMCCLKPDNSRAEDIFFVGKSFYFSLTKQQALYRKHKTAKNRKNQA